MLSLLLLLCWFFPLVRVIKSSLKRKRKKSKKKGKLLVKISFIWSSWPKMLVGLWGCITFCAIFQNSIKRLLRRILWLNNLLRKIKENRQKRSERVSWKMIRSKKLTKNRSKKETLMLKSLNQIDILLFLLIISSSCMSWMVLKSFLLIMERQMRMIFWSRLVRRWRSSSKESQKVWNSVFWYFLRELINL